MLLMSKIHENTMKHLVICKFVSLSGTNYIIVYCRSGYVILHADKTMGKSMLLDFFVRNTVGELGIGKINLV